MDCSEYAAEERSCTVAVLVLNFWIGIGKAASRRNFEVNVGQATQESHSVTWNTAVNMTLAVGPTRIYNGLQSLPPEYCYRFC
jgi:hypothetical protein